MAPSAACALPAALSPPGVEAALITRKASWEAGLPTETYAKVLADFEVLKHCDVIVGPVTSGYAKTAAFESMRVSRVHNQHTLGVCPHYHRSTISPQPLASRFGLEQCQPITAQLPVTER